VKADVENLVGGSGNDTLIGDGDANRLIGDVGRDRLIGRGGNDLLRAKDFVQDLRLACGPGAHDKVRRDSFDPAPVGCEL
jgi:Ca2+-binding RTX toxin-like protein